MPVEEPGNVGRKHDLMKLEKIIYVVLFRLPSREPSISSWEEKRNARDR